MWALNTLESQVMHNSWKFCRFIAKIAFVYLLNFLPI